MEKRKILVVDDEIGFANMVKLNLEATGNFEVQVETKGAAAAAAAKAFLPDLVFLDIIMPDISGSDVFAQFKEDLYLKTVPVVFLTAIVSSQEVSSNAGFIGGRPFLAKPVTTAQLVDCINKILR